MAIQVNGTQVIGNSRELTNIASVDATTAASITAAGVGGGGLEAWNPNATPNQTFTSSGTWTKPGGYADSTNVIFYLVGGGSSGGHYYGGPGGYGGGACILSATMGGLPSSISVTVGAGGARQTYFGNAGTNYGGNTTISSNGITYTAEGAAGTQQATIRPIPAVFFPSVGAPFSYDLPSDASATPGIIPTTFSSTGLADGAGSIFAAGDGGFVNPNGFGAGGPSTYAGNGGAGNLTYGANGSLPGGGGGGSYIDSGSSGGAGGNGSVRVYYIA